MTDLDRAIAAAREALMVKSHPLDSRVTKALRDLLAALDAAHPVAVDAWLAESRKAREEMRARLDAVAVQAPPAAVPPDEAPKGNGEFGAVFGKPAAAMDKLDVAIIDCEASSRLTAPAYFAWQRIKEAATQAQQPAAAVSSGWRGIVASALSEKGVYRYGLTKGVIDRIADDLAPHIDIAASRKVGMPAHVAAALAEVERATRKFPTWPTDPLHALAVLGEEFGELTKAVLQTVYEPHKVEPGELRTEAIQTAAMALRFLASLEVYSFKRSEQHQQEVFRG